MLPPGFVIESAGVSQEKGWVRLSDRHSKAPSYVSTSDDAIRRVPTAELDRAVDTLLAPTLELTTVGIKRKLLRTLRGEGEEPPPPDDDDDDCDCGGGDDSNGHGDRSPVEDVARASEAAEARGDRAGPNDRHRLPHYKQAVSLLARAPPGHYSPLLAARTCAKLARCHATAGNAWEALLAATGGLTAAAGRAALGSAEYSACAPLLFLLRCQRAAAAMELGLLSMAQRELSALAQERPLMPPLPAHGDLPAPLPSAAFPMEPPPWSPPMEPPPWSPPTCPRRCRRRPPSRRI